ncbi:MAG: isocitrate lyase/phosphoenolpyruvate mutase family protein [Candidatus Binatia bacterium]|nr:isocitrate lyase/phosphoenolpyruvate mutase family protein [Candidatus Binatia bacterium]
MTRDEAIGHADVLYAPGLSDIGDIRSVVAAVDRPLNALVLPGASTVAEIFETGVARISFKSAFNLATNAALVEAANEILGPGATAFWTKTLESAGAINEAFKGS